MSTLIHCTSSPRAEGTGVLVTRIGHFNTTVHSSQPTVNHSSSYPYTAAVQYYYTLYIVQYLFHGTTALAPSRTETTLQADRVDLRIFTTPPLYTSLRKTPSLCVVLCCALLYLICVPVCVALPWLGETCYLQFPLPFAKRAWSAARPPTPIRKRAFPPGSLDDRLAFPLYNSPCHNQCARLNTRCPRRRPTKKTKKKT